MGEKVRRREGGRPGLKVARFWRFRLYLCVVKTVLSGHTAFLPGRPRSVSTEPQAFIVILFTYFKKKRAQSPETKTRTMRTKYEAKRRRTKCYLGREKRDDGIMMMMHFLRAEERPPLPANQYY